MAAGDGAAALVNPVGDGRAIFSAPFSLGPWEEKGRKREWGGGWGEEEKRGRARRKVK